MEKGSRCGRGGHGANVEPEDSEEDREAPEGQQQCFGPRGGHWSQYGDPIDWAAYNHGRYNECMANPEFRGTRGDNFI